MSLRGFLPPSPPVYAGQDPYLRALSAWAMNLVAELKNYVDVRDNPVGGYTTSNVTATRTFDADNTTDAEVADVLGTVIADLKTKGILK